MLFYPNWGSHSLQGKNVQVHIPPWSITYPTKRCKKDRKKKHVSHVNCCNCLLLFSNAITFFMFLFSSPSTFCWWKMSIIQSCLCISVIICLISLTFQAKKGAKLFRLRHLSPHSRTCQPPTKTAGWKSLLRWPTWSSGYGIQVFCCSFNGAKWIFPWGEDVEFDIHHALPPKKR